MLKASFQPYDLFFKSPSQTSREVMTQKQTYFIKIWDDNDPSIYGLGECAIFRGLSYDDTPDYEIKLDFVCKNISVFNDIDLSHYPSILFGLETALNDLKNGGRRTIFSSKWLEGHIGIPINGLIWMGSKDFMLQQLYQKIKAGFQCVKIKIGGIDFECELEILENIRNIYPDLIIRLDANGAFTTENAMERLEALSRYNIHSIEQPIKPRQYKAMADICKNSPIPIALDEELIGIVDESAMADMLSIINPQYIILKPSLCGGFNRGQKWIDLAESKKIGWWITSALESNIGLNAIAQWTATLNNHIPQGLGTGALYSNNIPSPLSVLNDKLYYIPQQEWDFKNITI